MVCYYMFIAQGIPAQGSNSLPAVDMAILPRGVQLTGSNSLPVVLAGKTPGLGAYHNPAGHWAPSDLFFAQGKKGVSNLQKRRLPAHGWKAVEVAAWYCLLIAELTELPGCHGCKRRRPGKLLG